MLSKLETILAGLISSPFFLNTAFGQTCTPNVHPPAAALVLPPAGGPISKQMQPIDPGCTLNASTDVPWITISAVIPVATSYVLVTGTVAPNTGPIPLHGTITVTEGGIVAARFPVIVTSNSCSYSVNPPSAQIPAQGASGEFTVTATPPDCFPLDPNTTQNLTLVSNGSLNYDHGIFYYGIGPNPGAAASATATLGPGVTFTITQDAGDGSFQAACPTSLDARVGRSFGVSCAAVGGTPPYTWSLASGSLPPVTGFPGTPPSFGVPTTEGPFSFTVTAKDNSSPPHTVTIPVSGVVLPAIPSITCSAGGPVQSNVPYFEACAVSGGTGSYQWTISDGNLPNGLSLSPGPSGGIVVSGTPTDTGNFYYALEVFDTTAPLPLVSVRAFSGILYSTPPPLTMKCTGASSMYVVHQNYTQFSCLASGGIGQIHYAVSGTLPRGFAFSGNAQYPLWISGIPTTAGEYQFTLQAMDSASPTAQVAQQSFDITVFPQVTVTCTPNYGPTLVDQFYTTTCNVTGGEPPYTFSPPLLPIGLNFAQTGPTSFTVSGTPTAMGAYSISLGALDNARNGGSVSFIGRIASGAAAPTSISVTCSPSFPPLMEVGVAVTPAQCTATGGVPPYTWSTLGNVPPGLTVTPSGATFSISGTPTGAGTGFNVYVQDSSNPQLSTFAMSFNSASPRPTVACTPTTGPVSVGQVFLSNCTASGGVSPLTWFSSGNFPPGVSFDYSTFGLATATIHGSPTTTGPYNFTIGIQDSLAQTVSQSFAGSVSAVGASVLLTCSSSGGVYAGGSAIIPITCTVSGGAPPYQWTIANGSLPVGLSLTPQPDGSMAIGGTPSVAGSYSFAVSVSDTGGQTGSWPVSGTINNPPVSGFLVGILPHLAFGGGWQNRIALVNLGIESDAASLRFFDDAGNPLGFPYTNIESGSGSTASFFDRQLQPNQVVILDSTASGASPASTGSAQAYTEYSQFRGFAMFSYPAFNWEALVPLDTSSDNNYVIAFDNTGQLATGVAIATTATVPVPVSTVIRDDTGAVLQQTSINLDADGHSSFMLTQQFPVTAGKRGTVMFSSPVNPFRVLALRANGSALTTLPSLLGDPALFGGSIAHVTYNGGFTSSFYLVNVQSTPGQFTLSFYAEDGSPLQVPLLFPQTGTNATTASLVETLAPGAMLVIDIQSNSALPSVVGSARLTTTGHITGFEIFHWTAFGQEASVPIETRVLDQAGQGFSLIFDNTGGFTTGVALSNPGTQASAIPVIIHDEDGNLLQSTTLNLPANGHTSFMLPTLYPVTNGIRGSIEFVNPSGASISVIGLRAGPNSTLTTVPSLF